MARYFSGTSTGTKYEVGKDYVTGDGRVLKAQADGTFQKQGNLVGYTDQGKPVVDDVGRGATSRGSYGNPDVEWYASGSDAAAYRAAGGYSAPGQVMAGSEAPTGAVAVPPPTQSPVKATQANRGAFNLVFNAPEAFRAGGVQHPYLKMQRDNYAWSGEDLPPQDMVIGGLHLRANPKWSNGEVVEMLFGDNEVVSTLYSVFHVPAVAGYNARLWANENGWNDGKGASQAIERAFQPQALADTFMGAVDSIRKNHQPYDQAYDELMDAYDLRDELTRVEARKAGDWTAIDGVWDREERERARNPEPQGHGWINPGWRGIVPGHTGGW